MEIRVRFSNSYLHELIEEEVYKEALCIKNPIKRYWIRYMLRNFKPSTRTVYLLRRMQYYYSRNNIFSHYYALYLYRKIWKESGCLISPLAVIGKGFTLPHPTGIVIGGATTIGQNVTIYQNVTIGSKHKGDFEKGLQPIIGNNVICFSSSQILGHISIGNDSIVGAGSVVLNDVCPRTKIAGVPAKAILKNE